MDTKPKTTLPRRVLELCADLESRRRLRTSNQQKVICYLAAQLAASMERINELTPEGEIGILVPSVDDIIIEAEMRFLKPKEQTLE